MATQGEVRFASLLKSILEKIKGITMFTTETNEASYYKELQDLAADVNLMLDEKNPKRAIVTKNIIQQIAYYNYSRKPDPVTGLAKRSRQATAGHVYKILNKLFPILDVDPAVLIREVEVPKNPVGDVVTEVSEEDKQKTDEKPSDAETIPPGWSTGKKLAVGAAGAAAIAIAAKLLSGAGKKS